MQFDIEIDLNQLIIHAITLGYSKKEFLYYFHLPTKKEFVYGEYILYPRMHGKWGDVDIHLLKVLTSYLNVSNLDNFLTISIWEI